MGVHTVVACGTEEEGFALLPLFAGGEEGLAGLTQGGVVGVGFEGGQFRSQLLGFGGQSAVGGNHRVVHKLLGDGGGLAVVLVVGVVILLAAGNGGSRQGNHCHHHGGVSEKCFHGFISLVIVCSELFVLSIEKARPGDA